MRTSAFFFFLTQNCLVIQDLLWFCISFRIVLFLWKKKGYWNFDRDFIWSTYIYLDIMNILNNINSSDPWRQSMSFYWFVVWDTSSISLINNLNFSVYRSFTLVDFIPRYFIAFDGIVYCVSSLKFHLHFISIVKLVSI
jgi:hypothetical protein